MNIIRLIKKKRYNQLKLYLIYDEKGTYNWYYWSRWILFSRIFNTQRIEHLYQDIHFKKKNFHLHYGDLTDTISINNLIEKIKPDEIYNLGAQSHVAVSFELVEYTANVDALGTLRILEAIKNLELLNTKFYQASTSELYGLVSESPQNEATEFYPRSPYGFSKLS